MTANEIRQKYIAFFNERAHKAIGSSSLLPENDPSTLFTGSGMQQLIPYLLGETHPEGTRLVNSQKCFRAEDIDEVGDNRHTTFFEMLGNWSLGDYFKREQLPWFFEFLTTEIGIDPARLYVSVFAGDDATGLPQDTEAPAIWKELFAKKGIEAKEVFIGTEANGAEVGMQGGRIFAYGAKKNWWSRSGIPQNMPAGEPGGPDSEVFYEFVNVEHDPKFGQNCHPNCDCGRYMEIGNSVFMEYLKHADGTFQKLTRPNVDFGGGLERIAAAAIDSPDMFKVDLLANIINEIERRSEKSYEKSEQAERTAFRIVADHLRASVFLVADGAEPSNKEQGYITRRFLRRAIRYMDVLGMPAHTLHELVSTVVTEYENAYPYVQKNGEHIASVIRVEEEKFRKTLTRGLTEFESLLKLGSGKTISGKDAFVLFSTYGFPLEMTVELAKERGVAVDQKKFATEFEQHQAMSRTATAGTFKGGLADHSEMTTRLHTATHLLHATLRKVLGDHVLQKGSNITAERLRFDFSHPEKMTPDQIKQVEDMINDVVAKDMPVAWSEMTYAEAMEAGALGLFESKYGEKVKVYRIGDYSAEVCGGPHVTHTAEVGHFKITKEEAVAAGIRRIKAIVS